MKYALLLQPLAASTLLLAAGCGGGSQQSVESGNEVAMNEALANLDEAVPESVNQTGEGVDLVSLPPAPADIPAAESAPLTQAAQIAGEIDGGAGVERVPFEGGWAWRREGKIIRTASRDGRRVSYFRPGEATPFLVQQGEETFAYQGGRPQRAFDRRGRPDAVPPQRQEEARRLADQSRRDRDQAERAPRRPDTGTSGPDRGDRNTAGRGDNRPGTGRPDRTTTSSTTTTTTTTENAAGRDDRRGARDPRNRRDDQGNRQ